MVFLGFLPATPTHKLDFFYLKEMSSDGDKPIPLASLSIEELNKIRQRTEEVYFKKE